MEECLKTYQVVMRTVGPLFIGSGREINKKEYLFLNGKKQVAIPDIQKLYFELSKRRKAEAFEEYLLSKGNLSLTDWLFRQKINANDLKALIRYKLDCGDAVIDKGANRLQIMECMKDAYGMPYVPGSSLKGMFRTILLGADIRKSPDKYRKEKSDMWESASGIKKSNRNNFLKNEIMGVEGRAFRTLERPKTKPQDAVNDFMQGFIVSDSELLSTEDLVLCQKIDRHTDGGEKALPLLRECIKPDTQICFSITIDTTVCQLSDALIMDAVKCFMTDYYNLFFRFFQGMDIPKTNYVICGGGSGFVSKTIIYPMYRKEKGVEFAQKVFNCTLPPKINQQHRHDKDKDYGVSPHTIKCTRYQGRLLPMGVCKIKITEK